MTWTHKGLEFTIRIELLGPFHLAAARVPSEGPFVRIRPFSALGTSEEEAIQLLQDQIRLEYRKVPRVSEGGGATPA